MIATGNKHWARHAERGSYAMMRLTAGLLRALGRTGIRPLVYLIVVYFFLSSRQARACVREYQTQLATWSQRPDLQPGRRSVFSQFLSFGDALVDKLDVWHNRLDWSRITVEDPDGLRHAMQTGRGQILVCAHLGNLEVCRALAHQSGTCKLNVLVHTRHAEKFNRLMRDAGASDLNLIQVTELDAGTMLHLAACIERGEWLAIAGDRVPVHGSRHASVDFMGRAARLPQGPYLLAGLLKCPVNLLWCTRRDDGFLVRLERFADEVRWQRGNRDEQIRALAQRYADRLAAACLETPSQWFNFFPFWSSDVRPPRP